MASPVNGLPTATGVLARPCASTRATPPWPTASHSPLASGCRPVTSVSPAPSTGDALGVSAAIRNRPRSAPTRAPPSFSGLKACTAERGAFNVVDGFQTRIGSEYAVLGPQQPI